jgi:hypothetical protein
MKRDPPKTGIEVFSPTASAREERIASSWTPDGLID